jgi:hypothetical protein
MNAKTVAELNNARRKRHQEWDKELAESIETPNATWQDSSYEPARFAKVGLMLGALAGCTSLLVNVIGSVLWPAVSEQAQHPLRIIQVLLTFPLGESALRLDSGAILATGCLLFIGTGMLYGVLFELILSSCIPRATLRARFAVCSVLALGLWVVNFYAILSWMQPLLLGGRWILQLIPWWVAAATHLVFGWTMAFVYPLGRPEATRKHVVLD